ncbi:MAG: hypothetical protein QF902_11045 [Rhodospirillales bacterium]|nr:hypothetical protein [Rhodospirillales bacterium]
MKVTKSGKTLTIDGRKLAFDQRVEAMVVLDHRVIIELDADDFELGDPLVGRNILAFDSNGEMLWRIPATGMMVRDDDSSPEAPEAFFGLGLHSDGKTITIGTPDMIYEVDPETGKIFNGIINK